MTDISPAALRDKVLRVDAIINLAYAIASGRAGEILTAFIENDLVDAKLVRAKSTTFETIASEAENGDDDVVLSLEYLEDRGVDGVLIKGSRPVMKYFPNGRDASFSWGESNYEWIYGETLEDALTQLVEWADRIDAKQRAKVA